MCFLDLDRSAKNAAFEARKVQNAFLESKGFDEEKRVSLWALIGKIALSAPFPSIKH